VPVPGHHLAQLNVARLVAPLEHPQLAEFVALLDPINKLADGSPGFVWRYTTPGENNATADRSLGDDEILNLSVWESRQALWDFVYRSRHLDVLRQRRDFFHAHSRTYLVLWWVPAGTIPTVEESHDRLRLLHERGPSPRAFTFREAYEPDGSPVDASTVTG
jgi:Domain of unknown function (DUF3291)